MPYEVIWTDNGVIQKFSGAPSSNDIEGADKLVYGSYRFDNRKYCIADLMAVTDHSFQDEDPAVVAHMDHAASSYKKNLKLAIACPLPSLMPLINEYIQQSISLGSTWDIRHFTDLKSAENWAKS